MFSSKRKVGLYGLYECKLYMIIPVPLPVFGHDPVAYAAVREVLHTTVFGCDGGTRSELEVYFQRLQLRGVCEVFAQIKTRWTCRTTPRPSLRHSG